MPRTPIALALAAALALLAVQQAGGQSGPGRPAAVLAVHEAQDRLRDEIAVLRSLLAAQQQLLAWSGIRLRRAAPPVGLTTTLCEEDDMRKWCEALPATFGRHEAAR